MLTEMCISKLSDNNVYRTSRFMFRSHYELVPDIFHGYFTPNMDVDKYYTGQSTYLNIPVVKSDLSKFRVFVSSGGDVEWDNQAWYRFMFVWNGVYEIS